MGIDLMSLFGPSVIKFVIGSRMTTAGFISLMIFLIAINAPGKVNDFPLVSIEIILTQLRI